VIERHSRRVVEFVVVEGEEGRVVVDQRVWRGTRMVVAAIVTAIGIV